MAEKSSGFSDEMLKRIEASEPKLVSSDGSYKRRSDIEKLLPEGCFLDPPSGNRRRADASNWTGSGFTSGGGGNSLYHTQRPYLPEYDSPDRQWYPDDRLEANFYWRMFYKLDPIFGTAVDMYSGMMVSDFDIVLENETDSTITNQLNYMCEKTQFLDKFQSLVKEFLVTGEAIPHCLFNEKEGIWSYIAFHNPDDIEVYDSPLIDMDPILYYTPDDGLRSLLMDNTPESFELKKRLPSELVSRVLAKQKVRLSPMNCTFIPRKLHPYNERGTSLASRLWRIWAVEDAVYNSTLATFRRSAAPLKVAKMGDASMGYIPSPEQEDKLMRLLTAAEMDPQAWLVTNYAVNYEAWGNTDRAVTLSKEYDTIEKIKLLAMGLSKSFMTGEISFSSVKAGLQVFLRRLLSMRQFFENVWILPKFIGPVIRMNDWVKSTPAELNHRIRIKRTAQEAEEAGLLIVPKIKWRNKLDPSVDEELLRAYSQLKNFGFVLSQDTVGATVSLNWENELKKTALEFKAREEILQNTLGSTLKEKFEQSLQAPKTAPPGAAGSGAKPPMGAAPKQAPGGKPVSNPPGTGEAGQPEESINPASSNMLQVD